MPEKTGFDLLEELINVPHVIFTYWLRMNMRSKLSSNAARLFTQANRNQNGLEDSANQTSNKLDGTFKKQKAVIL